MISKPIWLKFLFSDDCENCIDYKSPTHGHVIHGIKDMAQGFINAYAPVTCYTLLIALRRWQLIELQSNISLSELINIIFDAIRLELGDSKHCVKNYHIHLLETNIGQIKTYFNNIENGVIDELFGIKMIYHQKCVKCMYQWFKFRIENFINLPIHGLHARYWFQKDGDILAHSFDITPDCVLKMSLQQLIVEAVSDYESLDDDIEIQIKQHHIVCLNDKPKYFVYWTYISDNMMWFAKKLHEVQITVYEYVKQFKYTIVVCEIPASVSNYDNINFQSSKCDFVDVVWPDLSAQNNAKDCDMNIINAEEKKNAEEGDINCLMVPVGDTTISLTHQWEQYINNGQVIEDTCHQCQTKQKIISKPQVFAFPSNPIVYINQQQFNYYKLLWPFKTNQIHLSMKSNQKKQPKTFQINCFISQQKQNGLETHWRTNESYGRKIPNKNNKEQTQQYWYTINKDQIHKHENIKQSEHACVFILNLK